MPEYSTRQDEIKRKIRQLKKLELKIRFGDADISPKSHISLVWDTFFDLRDITTGKAKFSINDLCAMSKDEYKNVTDEFFFHVYYRLYKENGLMHTCYSPDLLANLGLPYDADESTIKSKFRELALKYHPDTGGDASKFIDLMDSYRKLIKKGK